MLNNRFRFLSKKNEQLNKVDKRIHTYTMCITHTCLHNIQQKTKQK